MRGKRPHLAIFRNFLSTATGRRVLKRFDNLKKELENPVAAVIAAWGNRPIPQSYLDIGGGTGERTLEIAQALRCKNVCLLEPSPAACRSFIQKAACYGIDQRRYLAEPFERFISRERFDLISSIHSWYYIPLAKLRHLPNLLAKNGLAAIYLDSRHDIIKKIQNICEAQHGFSSYNAEDIIAELKRANIPFRIVQDRGFVTDLVRHGRLTPKARTVASLLSWMPWRSIDRRTKDEILKLLLLAKRHRTSRWLITICG